MSPRHGRNTVGNRAQNAAEVQRHPVQIPFIAENLPSSNRSSVVTIRACTVSGRSSNHDVNRSLPDASM
jgi:hypothetical protein